MSEIEKEYQKLISLLRTQNPYQITQQQRIDWAYGTAVIENPNVTMEMVERAAKLT